MQLLRFFGAVGVLAKRSDSDANPREDREERVPGILSRRELRFDRPKSRGFTVGREEGVRSPLQEVTSIPNAAAAAAFLLISSVAVFARPTAPIGPVKAPPAAAIAAIDRGHDWPKYCADLEMTGRARYETKISPASAAALRLAWQVKLSGIVGSTPTIVAGSVYIGDWGGIEWRLDAATGAVLAHADLGRTVAAQCGPSNLGITSVAAYANGRLYLAGGDNSFYCLDAQSLQTAWKTPLGDNSAAGGYYGWSSPAPLPGKIYQGVSSNCDNPFIAGEVVSLDPASGTVIDRENLSQTSDPSHFGSGVWSSPAIDLDSGSVFVTTASAYHYDDGLAYSVVRLSLENLAVQDSWKITPDDFSETADPDWGSSPTLFHDANGRLLVGASQKNGKYYALDRANLAQGPVWETPVAIPGPCPQCGDGSISTAAFDGSRLYVGGGNTGFPRFDPGAVTALDPATGRGIWSYSWQLQGPVLGPVSVANGVVFAAAGTSCLALDAATGSLLWKADTAAMVYAGVAISDGRVFFGDTAGNLYCYEIPAP